MKPLFERNFIPELIFLTSRSSGPGGQHVNKVNSKVELRFNILQSTVLTEDEKNTLLGSNIPGITSLGEIRIVVQEERSQFRNKLRAYEKFIHLLAKALVPKTPRRATRPTKASVERRLETKRKNSQKKSSRRKEDY